MGSTTFNKPLDDEVAALNSKVTIQVGNVTRSGSYTANEFVYKSGETKFLIFSIGSGQTTVPQNSYTTVMTLPAGYRPQREFAVQEMHFNVQVEIRFFTNGDVKIYNYGTNRNDGDYAFTFI